MAKTARLLALTFLFSLMLLYTSAVTAHARDESDTVISWPYLNVSTKYLKLSFDLEHGGVLTSVKYEDLEMISGAGGRWGSVALVRQYAVPPSGGDICVEWGYLLRYQYDEGNVSVSSDAKKETVSVNIGTNLGMLNWEISKNAPKLSFAITPEPGLLPYYLYIPLAKEDATLDIHTFKGWRSTVDTAYCDSAYDRSTLVRYVKDGGDPKGKDYGRRMLIGGSRPAPVAYYGPSTESNWLLHYPIPPAGDYSLRFHFQRKKQHI